MNGFAEQDNVLSVREQDFSASMSRRPKISQIVSSGRLVNPLSYVIFGRGVGSDGVRVREEVITGPGSSCRRSWRKVPGTFSIGIHQPERTHGPVILCTHASRIHSPLFAVKVNQAEGDGYFSQHRPNQFLNSGRSSASNSVGGRRKGDSRFFRGRARLVLYKPRGAPASGVLLQTGHDY